MSRHQRADDRPGAAVRLSIFRNKRFDGYLRVELPHSLDAEVDAVVVAYMRGSEVLRQSMINDMDGRAAGIFSAYGQRMASRAVRAASTEILRRGIVAVGLAQERLVDPRDNLYVLAAINDSAALNGTSLSGLVSDVERMLPAAGLAALRKFDGREEADKSLEAMNLRKTGSGEKFLYV